MFDNPLDNDTYVDNFIANNANFIDSNSDIITPSNLEINSLSNAIDSLLMDSLLTAKDLGTLSDKQTQQGSVSPIDRKDFYHFSTDKIGDLDYRLTGLSSGANIQLLDSDGDMLSGSFKPGKANEYKVHHNLPAGDYYLKVYGFNTDYNLDVELLGDPDAMNSFFTAKDLGTISGKQETQQGTVTKEDRLDIYQFRTDETGDLEYNLTDLSSNANIQLLDSDGDMLSGSFNPGKADEYKVHQDLVPGNYYLKVYGGGTDYNLDFGLLADSDAMNSLLTAKDLGTLAGKQTQQGTVINSPLNYTDSNNLTPIAQWTLPSTFYPQNQLNPLHRQIIRDASQLLPRENTKEWGNIDALEYAYLLEIKKDEAATQEFIDNFKNQWVCGYKDIINEASNQFNIPPDLLAAIAREEVGGDPPIFDLAADARSLGLYPGHPDETSFGNTSIQLRNAASALGYDPNQLTPHERTQIRYSLQNSNQSLFITAKYLSDLREKYLPNKTRPSQISEREKLALAGAYHRGAVYSNLEDFWTYPGNGKNYAGGYGRSAFDGLKRCKCF